MDYALHWDQGHTGTCDVLNAFAWIDQRLAAGIRGGPRVGRGGGEFFLCHQVALATPRRRAGWFAAYGSEFKKPVIFAVYTFWMTYRQSFAKINSFRARPHVPSLIRRAAALATLALLAACGGGSDDDEHLFHQQRAFDLQAHRGGLGLVVESTVASFSNALEMGVTTLELDTQVTADGVAVVTHDRRISNQKCRDAAPAAAGDPLYPYVGRYIKDLTLAQVKTLDCGSLQLAAYPEQRLSPGARIPTLREVFDLVKTYRADDVLLNVETKVEAGAPQETAPREQFVQVVVDEIRRSGLLRQVTVQSFDWGALMLVRKTEPRLPIVALTNGQQFLQAGQPGPSPWLGGIDIDDFGGDLVAAAKSFGADAISPVHGDPQNGKVGDVNYKPYTTADMVARAHAANIKVVPWTVSDEKTMHALMDAKVDGLITDLPDVLRKVMAARGLPLPPPAARR